MAEQKRENEVHDSGERGRNERWHALSVDDIFSKLESDRDGISQQEAEARLDRYGPNQVRQQQTRPWWRRLVEQFSSILVIVLIIAGIISVFLGKWVDAGAIAAVVLVNAAVGFIQEGRAEQALESIKNMLSPHAKVLRGGEQRTISATEVVPGDLVILSSGDRVPADMRLIEASRCRTQEAPLTGESEAVSKTPDPVEEDADLAECTSMAYAGTLVAQGKAAGVVVATGDDTEIGRISAMLQDVETLQTPLTRQLDRFGRVLATGIVAIAAAMGVFGVVVYSYGITDMFMAGVGLAVAAIPQGLPAIVTITLALGVQAMAKRNAIVRRLPAVETLGSVATIFSDKTGTLTRNEMTAHVIALADGEINISGVGFAPEGEFHRDDSQEKLDPNALAPLQSFLVAGALCNDASLYCEDGEWQVDGDPTEAAFIVAAAKAGSDLDTLKRDYRRVDLIPFESERKYMATLNETPDGQPAIYVKGAPDVLLEMCSGELAEEGERELDADQWRGKIEDLSSRGLRVLAVARKGHQGDKVSEEDIEKGLMLVGLVGLLDPPRESVAESIRKCQSAGIEVKMVTGDHALTASAIAAKLGLNRADKTLSGKDLDELSDEQLQKRVGESSVFARAAPEHKLRLVQATQAQGRVCAMTGDGVNDAPALKRADVGVAMGVQGTEAAKEAAEMVLADDNFATIVGAVEQGRNVYSNITKTISFLLPTNGAESLAILLAVMAGTMLPITPVQILWVNMITAVTLGLALAFEPADEELMTHEPRDPHAPILNRFLLWRVLFVSTLLVAAVYGLFLWLRLVQEVPLDIARSVAVNMLVAGEIVYLLNVRLPLARSLSIRGLFGSRPVMIAVGLVILFQLLWTYAPPLQYLFGSAPLGLLQWGLIIVAAVAVFLIVEVEKTLWRHLRHARD